MVATPNLFFYMLPENDKTLPVPISTIEFERPGLALKALSATEEQYVGE